MVQQTEQPNIATFTSATDTVKPDSKKNLKPKLKDSKEQLNKIQKDVEKLIDAIVQNPSIISRASNYWGTLPLWKKIVAGVVLVAPPLALGIIANLFVCLVITAFTLATYISTSVILDDHYSHTKHSTEDIKGGVTSLAENLDLVTKILEEISNELAEQVDLFNEENIRFGKNIDDFADQNVLLVKEIAALKETERKLRTMQQELETTCEHLKLTISTQSNLLEETQADLQKIRVDYALAEQTLRERNTALERLQRDFQNKVEQYDAVVTTLQTSIEQMSSALILDDKEQAAFREQLSKFIKDKNASFVEILGVAQRAEQGLAAVNEQLRQAALEQGKLLVESAANFSRLKELTQAKLLHAHGLYAQNPDQRETPVKNELESPTL